MEFVNYSDDDEDDKNVSGKVVIENNTEKVDVPSSITSPSRWASKDIDESSGSEEEDVFTAVENTKKESTHKNVSVLELLSSSQKPSFLSKPSNQQKFQIKPVVLNDYNVKPKASLMEQPTPQEISKGNLMTKEQFEEIAKSKAVSDMMREAEESLPLNAKVTAVKRDKETAKDRVKRQRLSGQSGIGEDFKVWKSDEEMRQRQQYD